jgi:hypothetical protein
MYIFPGWQKYVVVQKRPLSGCIPAGYEFLLRTAGVSGVNFETFQDDFDLDTNLDIGEEHHNNFKAVARCINEKYPHITFVQKEFEWGIDKLRFIEERASVGKFVLVSLCMIQLGIWGYHIMPVVDLTESSLVLLLGVENNTPQLLDISKDDFVQIHDKYPGGKDIAYLET